MNRRCFLKSLVGVPFLGLVPEAVPFRANPVQEKIMASGIRGLKIDLNHKYTLVELSRYNLATDKGYKAIVDALAEPNPLFVGSDWQ